MSVEIQTVGGKPAAVYAENAEATAMADHFAFLRCCYHYVRPHRALKYGRETWTPAMQAGLASRRLSFRDVFTSVPELAVFVLVVIRLLRRWGWAESGRIFA